MVEIRINIPLGARTRVERFVAACVVGQRQRGTAGTGDDIEYSRSAFQFSSRCERGDNSTRQERLVASVIDRGVRREVDSIAQFTETLLQLSCCA